MPLYIDDRAPAHHNHDHELLITHVPVGTCFGDKVLVGTQKMHVIKVTILLKNEVKIGKIDKKYKTVKFDNIMKSTKNILIFS